jgi:hypothetical protein
MASKEEGSNTSSPKLDVKKGPAMDGSEPAHQVYLANSGSVGQNPMFIMYGGRRPSAMSTWSADSLDGTLPSNSTDSAALATVNNGGDGMLLLQQNGQNPLFVMYNGRRPSAGSINSYKLDGRRPSGISTISTADSLDGTLPLIASSDSNPRPPHRETPCITYPPLVVTTVPYVGSDVPISRVLSPIHEYEDDNEEENPAIITKESRKSSTVQRSNSYAAALDDAVSMEYSRC